MPPAAPPRRRLLFPFPPRGTLFVTVASPSAPRDDPISSCALAVARTEAISVVRRHVTNLKTTAGFGEGDARALDLPAAADRFDPTNYQPQVSAFGQHGRIVINGRKLGAEVLNLYVRRQGETSRRLLAAKLSGFPFDDATASASGAPEVREYQAVGVEGDAEIGQPSPIVTAVWSP